MFLRLDANFGGILEEGQGDYWFLMGSILGVSFEILNILSNCSFVIYLYFEVFFS